MKLLCTKDFVLMSDDIVFFEPGDTLEVEMLSDGSVKSLERSKLDFHFPALCWPTYFEWIGDV